MDSSDLVVLRTFSTVAEAEVARSVVRAAGIAAVLADEHIVTAQWLYSNAVGGVKVLVPSDSVSEAMLLRDTPADIVPPSTGESGTHDRGTMLQGDICQSCGGSDIELMETGRRFAGLTWLMLGLPIVRVRRSRRCRACGSVLD